MSDRNWDAEMAKIDKQLASMSDADLIKRTAAPSSAGAGASTATSVPKAGTGVDSVAPSPGASVPSRLGVAFRVGLGVVLAAGVPFWPYAAQCGASLAGYLAAIGVVVAAGVWGAASTWRARSARAHVVALAVTAWGVALVAREVLPRAGYAADAQRAVWVCQ